MPLQIEKNVARSENALELLGDMSNFLTPDETTSERTPGAARQADKTASVTSEILERDTTLTLRGIFWRAVCLLPDYAELRIGEESAEILYQAAAFG